MISNIPRFQNPKKIQNSRQPESMHYNRNSPFSCPKEPSQPPKKWWSESDENVGLFVGYVGEPIQNGEVKSLSIFNTYFSSINLGRKCQSEEEINLVPNPDYFDTDSIMSSKINAVNIEKYPTVAEILESSTEKLEQHYRNIQHVTNVPQLLPRPQFNHNYHLNYLPEAPPIHVNKISESEDPDYYPPDPIPSMLNINLPPQPVTNMKNMKNVPPPKPRRRRRRKSVSKSNRTKKRQKGDSSFKLSFKENVVIQSIKRTKKYRRLRKSEFRSAVGKLSTLDLQELETLVNKSVNSRQRFDAEKSKVLVDWFLSNYRSPYPSTNEKLELAGKTGLSKIQVNDWFTNKRKRVWRPFIDKFLCKSSV